MSSLYDWQRDSSLDPAEILSRVHNRSDIKLEEESSGWKFITAVQSFAAARMFDEHLFDTVRQTFGTIQKADMTFAYEVFNDCHIAHVMKPYPPLAIGLFAEMIARIVVEHELAVA